MARSTLYEAATALLTRTKAFSSLKSWGLAAAPQASGGGSTPTTDGSMKPAAQDEAGT
jgi:hypothetical protein